MDTGREYNPSNINPERYSWGEATGDTQEDRIFFANVDAFQDVTELKAIIADLEKRKEANTIHSLSTGTSNFDKSIDDRLSQRLEVLRIRLKELKGEYYGGGGAGSSADYYKKLSAINMGGVEQKDN